MIADADRPTRGIAGVMTAGLLAAVLAVAAGCGTDPPNRGESCSTDADCPSQKYCGDDGFCAQDCEPGNSSECDSGNVCTARGECVSSSCSADQDCPPTYHCSSDVCSRECNPQSGSGCSAGDTCTPRGRCVPPGSCRTDSDCQDPPAAACDGNVLKEYESTGTCDTSGDQSTCDYPVNQTTCEYGCSRGSCAPDPCAGKTCDSPPAAKCSSDGSELITYETPGTCSVDQGGACEYDTSTKGCPNGCKNGRCESGPCSSVTCDSPPSDTCEGNRAVTYSETGACEETDQGTTCSYSPNFNHCSYTGATCNSAQCVNPVSQQGGIVISEYMADPEGRRDVAGEWFEIRNVGASSENLRGWKVTSRNDNDHKIGKSLTLDPGDRAVLARSSDPAGDGSVTPDYVFSDVRLANGKDWIRLVRPNGDIVDHVFWEIGTAIDGHSRKFDPTQTLSASSNDDFSNWCPSLSSAEQFSNGVDWGSPGRANPQCSSNPCAQYACQRPEAFCKDGDAVRPTQSTATCSVSRFNNPVCDYGVKTFNCSNTELCADGKCRSVPSNVPDKGDVVITELMGDPQAVSDANGEWIELYNTTSSKLSLFSVILEDTESGSLHDSHTILETNASIPAGGYAVLAVESDSSQNGGISGAYEYDGSHLKNSPGGLKIRLVRQDGTVIDESYYGTPTAGESQQLSLDAYKQGASNPAQANNTSGNWCAPTNTYGSGDKGSPGNDNRTCP